MRLRWGWLRAAAGGCRTATSIHLPFQFPSFAGGRFWEAIFRGRACKTLQHAVQSILILNAGSGALNRAWQERSLTNVRLQVGSAANSTVFAWGSKSRSRQCASFFHFCCMRHAHSRKRTMVQPGRIRPATLRILLRLRGRCSWRVRSPRLARSSRAKGSWSTTSEGVRLSGCTGTPVMEANCRQAFPVSTTCAGRLLCLIFPSRGLAFNVGSLKTGHSSQVTDRPAQVLPLSSHLLDQWPRVVRRMQGCQSHANSIDAWDAAGPRR